MGWEEFARLRGSPRAAAPLASAAGDHQAILPRHGYKGGRSNSESDSVRFYAWQNRNDEPTFV